MLPLKGPGFSTFTRVGPTISIVYFVTETGCFRSDYLYVGGEGGGGRGGGGGEGGGGGQRFVL